jgi:fatty acid desaturase
MGVAATQPAEHRTALNLTAVVFVGRDNQLVLNSDYHRVHHRHPGRPWFVLPALHAQDNGRPDHPWSLGLLRQLRGLVAVEAARARPRPRPAGRGERRAARWRHPRRQE